MVEPLSNVWLTDDCCEMHCYEDFKTYALCMISTSYVIYVILVDHALVVKL